MRLERLLPFFFAGLLFSLAAAAQAPNCNGTCEPDPTSPSYVQTVQVRPQTYNARGLSSPVVRLAEGSSAQSPVLPGSESYNYAIPVLSLPGRNGLDLNLTLFYNSRVWTIDKANSTATFNADRDFPGYGFRLGYGYLEGPNNNGQNFLLTEPDGTKRELRLRSGTQNMFDSYDSSYIEYNSTTRILRRKSGIQWLYQQAGTTSIYVPSRIQDTNGNHISISYRYPADPNMNKQAIDAITDTLGRVITFNYDAATHLLTSLTGPAPGGGTRTFATLTWGQSALNYNFGLTVKDTVANGTLVNVLLSCTYANNTGYNFVYGDWGIVSRIERKSSTAQLQSYVSYNYPAATSTLWDHPTFNQQTVFDGVNTSIWTYSVTKSNGLVSAFSVADPAGTTSTTNLATDGTWRSGLVSSVTIQSAGATLRTVINAWTQDDIYASYKINPRLASVTTQLENGQQSKVEFSYTTNGNVSEVREYDYGLVLKRRTQTDYLTTSPYTSAHILDRPAEVRIYDESGALKAKTVFQYDVTTLSPSVSPVQWADPGATRGNVSSFTGYENAALSSGPITRTFTYDTAGNLRQATVNCCQQQTWDYTATTQFAFPETITRGTTPQLSTRRAYDFATGLVTSVTDENNKTTSFEYNDPLYRLTKVTRPDNVAITTEYFDSPAQPQVKTTMPLEAGKSLVQVTTRDGLGRAIRQETRDGSGVTYSNVETQYDAFGRPSKVSNPHAPGQTTVWTETQYDGLGRVKKVIPPDGSPTSNNTTYAYQGNRVTVTDPAGKQRRTYTDALGRVTRVDEPGYSDGVPGTGSVTISGQERCIPQPGPCEIWDMGTVSVTVDTFTATANYFRQSTTSSIAAALRNVFNTSSSSPVTAGGTGATITLTAKLGGEFTNYPLSTASATDLPGDFGSPSFSATPSGPTLTGGQDGTGANGSSPSIDTPLLTHYTYDALDNLTVVTQGVQQRSFVYDSLSRVKTATTPEAGRVDYAYNSFSLVTARTDARGVATNYTYDGLNRLTAISYSVPSGVSATSAVNLFYDEGGAAANALGRLTRMTGGVGEESYQYDALGRTTQGTKGINGTPYIIGYGYNWAGELTSITYPSGRVVQQAFDAIGRLSSVLGDGISYISGYTYNAADQMTGFNYGNGVVASLGYSASRSQLTSLTYTKGSQTLFGLSYGYGHPNGGNSGQITSITDNFDPTRTTTYTYDAWVRLKTAVNGQWNLSWDYDRFGNRKNQNANPGIGIQLTISQTTNRVSQIGTVGTEYDAAGNLTKDDQRRYFYDAENRLTEVKDLSGTVMYARYTYDGAGLRVKKEAGGTTAVYVFSNTSVLAEYENATAPSSPAREYIYSGTQLRVTLEGGTINYHHTDGLSVRVTTDATGNVVAEQGHYPFGETWYQASGGSKWQFTSYERDGESSSDYAVSRYYFNRLGRFSSPDPVAGDLADPQRFNRYGYVMNDPVNLVDPEGLDAIVTIFTINDKVFRATGYDRIEVVARADGSGISGVVAGLVGSAPPFALRPRLIDGKHGAGLGGDPIAEGLTKLKGLIPSVCGGGGFGYAGLGGEWGKAKAESLAIVQWDSQQGGSHGGIVGLGYGSHVVGVESTRTWSDWQEHTTWIYLPGKSSKMAPRRLGPMTLNKDYGGILQSHEGQLTLGLYGGLSGKKGRAGGMGLYVSLSWNGCQP